MNYTLMSEKFEVEEEKKEGTGNKGEVDSALLIEDKSALDSDSDVELEELSPEILESLGGFRRYESEEELRNALDKAGLGDLRIALVGGRPHKVLPSDQHNEFTTQYVNEFNDWRMNFWGKWGTCSATHKMHLFNGNSRDPDLSFWGYPRCNPNCTKPIGAGSIPDVVIGFRPPHNIRRAIYSF